ncbi:MAG: FAD-dependent oxidoreductase, partial [Acidimicrobiales bacterium]
MVVIGAGLAGLSAALHLSGHGRQVTLLDGADRVGGRVGTDVVDGYRLDRGFQVFNTAYPEPARVLDLAALDLHPFVPGVLVYAGGRRHRLLDPARRPRGALPTALAPVGSLGAKARLGALAARDALVPARWLKRGPDPTTGEALARLGLSGPLVERFLRPFLSGVFLEAELTTSARFFHLVWRSFARGRICLPGEGMGAIPAQLASRLGPTGVRLGEPVQAVLGGGVTLAGGSRIRARAVVVATDPAAAAALLPSLPAVPMRGITTFYHRAPGSPL